MSAAFARMLNAMGLLGLSGILLIAFGYQFINGELPCPLCLLQRAAIAAAGVGLALNVCVGSRPAHYAITIISGVVGAVIAGRQVLLHIVPGTGSYGSPLLGIHFYTWALIAFALTIVAAAVLLIFERQFAPIAVDIVSDRPRRAEKSAVVLFLLSVAANAVLTFAECGMGLCPDSPTSYELFRWR
jgi:disulfide bond formation protein DsbB